jgi:hypothetical protein
MAAPPETVRAVVEALGRITAAWREGRPRDMAELLDEDVAMAFPEFAGRLEGREALIASFEDFQKAARVLEYREGEAQIDGVEDAAVAQVPFEMVYERDGRRWRSTGWDVWAFARRGERWQAIWRTLQGLAEQPADARSNEESKKEAP